MQRKSTTKKKAAPKPASKRARKPSATRRPEQVWMEAELAAHIAAVIAHPFTPPDLYNAIVQTMCDLDSNVPAKESTDTPEYIERVLNYHRGFGYRNIGSYKRVRQPDGRVFAIAVPSQDQKGGESK
jgi:hypothetical protein